MDQLVQHLLSPRCIKRNQALQCRQRIEQHVRFNLRLQHLQLRLQRLFLDGGGACPFDRGLIAQFGQCAEVPEKQRSADTDRDGQDNQADAVYVHIHR